MRTLAVILLVLSTGTALAHPPPPPPPPPYEIAYEPPPPPPEPHRPAIDWSTWFRIGMGMQSSRGADVPRSTTTPAMRSGHEAAWEIGLGAEATIGISRSGDVRVGPWLEVRGIHDVVAGGEVVVQRVPKSIDMFFYSGQGVLMLRGGGNTEHWTGQISYGYLAPWKLFAPARGDTRYTIGVRFVGTFTREFSDPKDWKATLGIEVEPIGALRYLLGIRSLYR